MTRKMLINAVHPEECRVAVVSDGIVEELDVQIRTHEATLANIYKGVVTKVEPSLQAVFVDYGAFKNGFLSISDVHPSYLPDSFLESRRRPRIEEVFKKGDHVIVQVAKEQRDRKGASLTTNISLAGRYLVLMPGSDLQGVSRKIEDEQERRKLKEIARQLKIPDNLGIIIRTAGMGRSKMELSRDLNYLLTLWQSIEAKVADQTAPSLLYREHDVAIRSIRDHLAHNVTEILVDDKTMYEKAKDFFRQVMPKYEKLVKLYTEKRPIFNKYQLEEQVLQIHNKRVSLKSGGSIVIEPTEAVVTVDVNSGGATREKSIEETAFRVNMEAAVEIARQLRLRDLGGIIVIDFIDMGHKRHKQEVERALKFELKKDRAKTKVLRISTLGVLELSRQRLKSSIGTGAYRDCPVCYGEGKVRHPEMIALSVFRRIKSLLIKRDVGEVRATVPAPVAAYLLNKMRAEIVNIEDEYQARVIILTKEFVPDQEIVVEATKSEPAEQASTEKSTGNGLTADSEAQPVQIRPVLERASARRPTRRRRRPRRRPTGPGEDASGAEAKENGATADQPAETVESSYKSDTRYNSRNGLTSDRSSSDEENGGKKNAKTSGVRRWFPFL